MRATGPFVGGIVSLAWSSASDEVWYGGINAMAVDGKTRQVWSSTHANVHDIARDGRVLLEDFTGRRELVGYSSLDAAPRNLTALNWSFPTDISASGDTVLLYEQQLQPPAIYLRKLDGSPAVRIGEGEAYALSPDGRWAVTTKIPDRRPITLIPTGAGEPKTVDIGNLTCQWANWFPDGKRILIMGSEPGRGSRLYVQDLAGGKPRAITPEGVTNVSQSQSISPDGQSIVARGPDGRIAIYPVQPGEARLVPGLEPEDVAIRWTADGRSLYVTHLSDLPGVIDVVDVATGRRTAWKQFVPPDATGVEQAGPASIAPDGKSYVYSYRRVLSDLYMATGMR